MRRDMSPYFYDSFTRQQWARFDAGSYRLAPAALTLLMGVNEPMPISEVKEVIEPLCRLLDIQMEANDVRPFVLAVAGSVAVGKSTFARVLRALLAQAGRTVELVATDGFLWPTAILEKRNLMRRKGFPESYDLERMLVFLAELKEGKSELRVPVGGELPIKRRSASGRDRGSGVSSDIQRSGHVEATDGRHVLRAWCR